jgi:RNA polymerase sigma-70 factor (ECF subfamily)
MKQEALQNLFLESFNQYSDAIYRFCVVKVSNTELAEDMTQEVFTRYWLYVRDEKEISNVRALLYTIAGNLAKDWYKKKKSVSLDERLENGLDVTSRELSSETQAQYNEVLTAMDDMDERDKEVLHLRYIEGFEPKQISEIIGESANNVSVRLNRAVGRLKDKMHV